LQFDADKKYFKRQTLRAYGGKDEDGTPKITVDPPGGRVKEGPETPSEAMEMTGHLEKELDMPRWAALDAKVGCHLARPACLPRRGAPRAARARVPRP